MLPEERERYVAALLEMGKRQLGDLAKGTWFEEGSTVNVVDPNDGIPSPVMDPDDPFGLRYDVLFINGVHYSRVMPAMEELNKELD